MGSSQLPMYCKYQINKGSALLNALFKIILWQIDNSFAGNKILQMIPLLFCKGDEQDEKTYTFFCFFISQTAQIGNMTQTTQSHGVTPKEDTLFTLISVTLFLFDLK